MKLYLLSIPDYDGDHILGAYSTREKAIGSFPFQEQEVDESNISEIEVDPPNGLDFHEKFYYFVICTDGSSWEGESRMTEKEATESFPFLSSRENGTKYSSLAYARTRELAIAKAKEGLKLLHPVWQVGRYTNSGGIAEILHAHPKRIHKWEDLPGHNGYAVHEDLETARQILFTYEKTGEVLPGFVPSLNATTPKESDPQ